MLPIVRSYMGPRGAMALANAFMVQGGFGNRNGGYSSRRELSTSQVGNVASTFFGTAHRTWTTMHDRGDPLGRAVWSNPKAKGIREFVKNTIANGDGHKGIIGWHATTTPEDILEQAKSNPEGRLEDRYNVHGEGLYLGSVESAVHYTGGSIAFKVASTNALGRNDDYGTGTTYLIPGTGKTFVLEARKVRDEYKEFRVPWPHKAMIQSLVSGVKAAAELYKKFSKS